MAPLTQQECNIIEQNPLGDALDAIREALRNAEPHATSDDCTSDDSADVPERPRLFMAATGKLFSSLSASEVALSLDSRTGRDFLASDLLVIRSRLQKGENLYSYCRPLSKLVIKKASDIELWGSIISLIQRRKGQSCHNPHPYGCIQLRLSARPARHIATVPIISTTSYYGLGLLT